MSPEDPCFWDKVHELKKSSTGESPKKLWVLLNSFAVYNRGVYLAWTLDEAKKTMLKALKSGEDWCLVHEEHDGQDHLWSLYRSTNGSYACGIWRSKIRGSIFGD